MVVERTGERSTSYRGATESHSNTGHCPTWRQERFLTRALLKHRVIGEKKIEANLLDRYHVRRWYEHTLSQLHMRDRWQGQSGRSTGPGANDIGWWQSCLRASKTDTDRDRSCWKVHKCQLHHRSQTGRQSGPSYLQTKENRKISKGEPVFCKSMPGVTRFSAFEERGLCSNVHLCLGERLS